MLFIAVVIVLGALVIIIPRIQPGRVNAAPLGSMSEQWLAEHRASHSR